MHSRTRWQTPRPSTLTPLDHLSICVCVSPLPSPALPLVFRVTGGGMGQGAQVSVYGGVMIRVHG